MEMRVFHPKNSPKMSAMASADVMAREKASRLLKKRTSVPANSGDNSSSNRLGPSTAHKKYQGSVSTVSHQDEPFMDESRGGGYPSKFENTFQLTPGQKFPLKEVENIVKLVLTRTLSDVKYRPELCRDTSRTISEEIRSRVKELSLPRYKVVTIVTIGELRGQSMRVASRSVWDTTTDTFASYQFKNDTLFAVGTVYGIYTD